MIWEREREGEKKRRNTLSEPTWKKNGKVENKKKKKREKKTINYYTVQKW